MVDASATYVVELTPTGRGAVAVVLVAGPEALAVVRRSFHRADGRALEHPAIGRIFFGRWGGPEGEELIICRRGEQQIEVHCHGGEAAVAAVMERLSEHGCRKVSWREWVLLSSDEPLRAAAQAALSKAPTWRTACVLLDQFHGALSGAVRAATAAMEAGDWHGAINAIDRVLQFRDVGLHLTVPWRVVLSGPPNVGKSSLLNAIAGFERAIVSTQAGTTRDIVTLETALDGWPIHWADTAGLRAARDEIEAAGIQLTGEALAKADLVLVVHDATSEAELSHSGDDTFGELHVLNKIDLIAPEERARRAETGLSLVSAVTGEGLSDLLQRVVSMLIPLPPPLGAPVPFQQEHVSTLEAARGAIEARSGVRARELLQSLLAGR